MIDKIVKGRKVYQCKYCGDTISIAEKHHHIKITPWSHSDNEGFDSWRIHLGCLDLGNDFYWDNDARGVFPDEHYSEFKDYIILNLKNKIARLEQTK